MTRVYIADAQLEERSALRLLLLDLKMEVVGEAADWITLTNAPATSPDMIVVDWNLLPHNLGPQALADLRARCHHPIVIVLLSQANAREQAAISAGADIFISKGELPQSLAERFRLAAASIPPLISPR